MNQSIPNHSPALQRAWEKVRQTLLDQRNLEGHWVGELSSSALATATAVSALGQYREHTATPIVEVTTLSKMMAKGCHWLLAQQNGDGGWGDTETSHSNVATTMLVIAAFTIAGQIHQPRTAMALERAQAYLQERGELQALRDRYGKDKTFAVPILANCAIAGLVPWKEVSALPFEAAMVPQRFYRFIHLPVVSYAIPALVAIGQVKFFKHPPWNPITRNIRRFSVQPGLRLLKRMQPTSGGFLEAIPLTSFVAMSLAHSGRADHPVVQKGIQFILDSFRDQEEQGGTWPIDTNLATWNTTLAVNALGPPGPDASGPTVNRTAPDHRSPQLLKWLLSCQFQETHPFTGAAPGGWGWSDLSGAVPDADDTPGALLAIRQWLGQDPHTDQQIHKAADAGLKWLLDLQNRDRGWPTFCRGWGKLPFDRSGNDITAHVLRALIAWQPETRQPKIQHAMATGIATGFEYLNRHQQEEGSWLPLWFGNQDEPDEENPIYGTTKVLLAYLEANRMHDAAARRGLEYLLKTQNSDRGWGGGASHERHPTTPERHDLTSSIQETALVVDLLARVLLTPEFRSEKAMVQACLQGADWLIEAVESDKIFEKWSIGFYFAKLWYYERLYPVIFTASALRNVHRYLESEASGETNSLS